MNKSTQCPKKNKFETSELHLKCLDNFIDTKTSSAIDTEIYWYLHLLFSNLSHKSVSQIVSLFRMFPTSEIT